MRRIYEQAPGGVSGCIRCCASAAAIADEWRVTKGRGGCLMRPLMAPEILGRDEARKMCRLFASRERDAFGDAREEQHAAHIRETFMNIRSRVRDRAGGRSNDEISDAQQRDEWRKKKSDGGDIRTEQEDAYATHLVHSTYTHFALFKWEKAGRASLPNKVVLVATPSDEYQQEVPDPVHDIDFAQIVENGSSLKLPKNWRMADLEEDTGKPRQVIFYKAGMKDDVYAILKSVAIHEDLTGPCRRTSDSYQRDTVTRVLADATRPSDTASQSAVENQVARAVSRAKQRDHTVEASGPRSTAHITIKGLHHGPKLTLEDRKAQQKSERKLIKIRRVLKAS
ncbi:hypothetical protein MRX96_005693 [Rhipicephalus microplus]